MRPARPGNRITDFVTTGFVNRLNKAAKAKPQQPKFQPKENNIRIWGIPEEDVEVARFEAVNISRPYLDFAVGETLQQNKVSCYIDKELTKYRWGVAQSELTVGTDVVLEGLTWVKFDMIEDDHDHLTIKDGQLVTSYIGEARIIYPTTPPREYGLVFLGKTDIALYRFELTEPLASGEAQADLFKMTGEPVGEETVKDPEGIFFQLSTGNRGLSLWDGYGHWVIQAPCPEDE